MAYSKYKKKWNDEWRERNPEKVKNYKKDKKLKRDFWFHELKKGLKCSRCGEDHPACLQFHHRNPDDKFGNVSNLAQTGYSKEIVLEEIKKCEVVCANCHWKIHWEANSNLNPDENELLRKKVRYEEVSRGTTGRINIKRYVCTDPAGKEFITEHGLSDFCRNRFDHLGTALSSFMKVLKGEKNNFRGWKIHKL